MRRIRKGREPASLTAHRQGGGSYGDYRQKQELREALVAEQRGLCCYCMGRIRADEASMKVEHWRSQARYRTLELSYRNLLGACRGGQGETPCHQHCDTRKGERDLIWNPADPVREVEARVGYRLDGSIYSDDASFDDQMKEVLNLNISFLKVNRVVVLDSVVNWWKKEKARLRGRVPATRLRQKRTQLVDGPGSLTPYCQVGAWWLERKLASTKG
ncbi:MAG: TIGR02646 family protein [Gammaproteobacteria bacterium]|nr:TIGR02646 family protein [Gammaproteobacteria bacterium]